MLTLGVMHRAYNREAFDRQLKLHILGNQTADFRISDVLELACGNASFYNIIGTYVRMCIHAYVHVATWFTMCSFVHVAIVHTSFCQVLV